MNEQMMTAPRATILDDDERQLRQWCADWAECVRTRDLDTGRQMFCEGVIAFGTRNSIMRGLDELVERQWHPTWNATSDFGIEEETIAVDHGSAWLAGSWTSTGIADDGTTFSRGGRITLAFRRSGDEWLCTHSHLSDQPSPDL